MTLCRQCGKVIGHKGMSFLCIPCENKAIEEKLEQLVAPEKAIEPKTTRNDELQRRNEELQRRNEELQRRNEEQQREIERLKAQLKRPRGGSKRKRACLVVDLT